MAYNPRKGQAKGLGGLGLEGLGLGGLGLWGCGLLSGLLHLLRRQEECSTQHVLQLLAGQV